jgi:hypothetical protein
MEHVIDAIRAAVSQDATPEARASGVAACHSILAALGAKAGEPLGATVTPNVGPAATAIAALVRRTPPDQLFDMLIGKLQSMLPAEAPLAPVRGMNIAYVKVPRP